MSKRLSSLLATTTERTVHEFFCFSKLYEKYLLMAGTDLQLAVAIITKTYTVSVFTNKTVKYTLG